MIKSIAAVGPFVEFKREEIEQSISTRFEHQVTKHANRLAIQSKNHNLSYDALNKLANQLARAILRRSDNDQPISLLLEHDISGVVGVLAALKAGKPFVPLDPAVPPGRLHYALQDSHTSLLVTSDHSRALAGESLSNGVEVISLNDLDPDFPDGNLGITVPPDAASWILYTSGSTGEPKGVIQTHRNELHNIRIHTNTLKISADDRLTLLGSYSTGQGMQDIYTALLNGASLFLRNIKMDGLGGFAKWLMQERITVFHSAATVFRHFVYNLTGDEKFHDLRIIRLGSEQVLWKDVELYKKHFPDSCVLINALSCSEARTFRQFLIDKQTAVTGMVPVGHPVEDKDILLLDENGREVESYEIGEIAIRSSYLSPGYWRRRELTRAVFHLHPDGSDKRVYRTGDLGKMLSDGALEYLGRKDSQVKIRGFRVELHEVELALLNLPLVRQAVVLAQQDSRGERRLVAYLIVGQKDAITVGRLRSFLRRTLPDYMIPTAFVFLDYLPVTPTGKLDHDSLPKPGVGRPDLDVPFVVPRSPVEAKLVNIWRQVLGLDSIGIHDNFFDLGGDSLLAALMFGRIVESVQIKIQFEHLLKTPTIAGLGQRIARILQTGVAHESPPILRIEREHNLPLSFAQERSWFLDQWEPGGTVYNICRGQRLNGELDVSTLERSLTEVVARHEALRTTFPMLGGRPVQSIAPFLQIGLAIIDLETLSEREERASDLSREEAKRPFDLAHGPLFRFKLLRLRDQEHIFLLTVHQIIADGWSVQILCREIWNAYQAFSTGDPPFLTELAFQYVDFAAWQRDWLDGAELDSQLAYWKKQLARPLPVLDLPTDRPRLMLETFRGAREFFTVSRDLTETLIDASGRDGATLFMTLVAAFVTLLYRYTGRQDVIIGVPITNRNRPEIEQVMGPFVNTSVLRANLSGNPTFRTLVTRVRDRCLGVFAHQDLPFEKLVEVLQPDRDLSRNPLFQVMFILQNIPDRGPTLRDLTVSSFSVDGGTSKFDLTLSLSDTETGLAGSFEYNTDLFDTKTIEQMIGHFQTLLESIVADQDQRISNLSLLTKSEQDRLLIQWNDTEADYPRDSCINRLVETQAEKTPNAFAVEFEGKQLTYCELNRKANQLARYLRKLGVGVEKLVGICVERSLEMMIGLLGILKAGGVYVPLDPSHPRDRLAFMLQDAQVSVLLTEERLIEDRRSKIIEDRGDPLFSILDPQVRMVCLDRDWQTIAQESAESPGRTADGENLAYVIYTSGSTGRPKAVQVSHRSVVNCLQSVRERVVLTASDVFLAVTTISFDIAALELFLPLITGGKVVLASRDEALDGKRISDRIRTSGVTVMQATPSGWRLLLDAGWQGSEGFTILCGGEVLSRELADRLMEGGASLWNLYGPTEATLWSTISRVEAAGNPVPIGGPIANTQIYILDSHLQPVPVGVHGELCIGGDGVALGYPKWPELTAERFVPHPSSDLPGLRLYRTGDRARYRADGNIEFLGRVDNQVKIRGYRIELGEIETTLNQHPAVKETVVVTRERDSSGEKELVGYIVSTEDSVASLSDLRGFLREKLPDYMIPSLFVFLNALPLTPNGKIDRSILPPPDGSSPTLNQGFVEPRTEIEELVAELWRDVLKLDKIGVYDNFFELGGHSLLATRVVARLRKNFNIDLPLRRIFEMPTVAGLARTVETALRTGQEIERTPILPVSREKPVLPSIAQEPVLSLDEWAPGISVFNIPAAYRLKGTLDVVALEWSITRVVGRHEALRTTFPMVNGQYVQFISPSVSTKLEVIDLRNLPDEDRESEMRKLAREEAEQPFNLANGPLFRIRLLRLGDEDHLLLIIMHHIISDGWSMAVFFRDLAAFYEAFSNGCPPSLPELPIQYADFAHWQRQVLREKLMETQLVYWKKQLDGPLAPVEFPTSRTRVNELNFLTARKSVSITGDLFRSLKKVSQKEESTLFITFLTALKILLYCYTGQEDVRVGTLVANRNRRETENLIGHFANTLIIRTRLSGASSLRQVARQVRDKALDSYTHQDLPFEALVRELEEEKNFNRDTLCQVLFTYQTASLHPVKLPGLTVGFFDETKNTGDFNLTITTFDLILLLKERPDRLVGSLLYKPDLFDEAAINRLLGHFHDIVRCISSEPDRLVSELCSLGDKQR